MVASQGFEPQYAESESAVLPLNDEATSEGRAAFCGWGHRGEQDTPTTRTSYEVRGGWVNADNGISEDREDGQGK